MSVERIAQGYYAIVTEGVSVDAAVAKRIDSAFKNAEEIPADKLVMGASDLYLESSIDTDPYLPLDDWLL
jgi:hypothetical protein